MKHFYLRSMMEWASDALSGKSLLATYGAWADRGAGRGWGRIARAQSSCHNVKGVGCGGGWGVDEGAKTPFYIQSI